MIYIVSLHVYYYYYGKCISDEITSVSCFPTSTVLLITVMYIFIFNMCASNPIIDCDCKYICVASHIKSSL